MKVGIFFAAAIAFRGVQSVTIPPITHPRDFEADARGATIGGELNSIRQVNLSMSEHIPHRDGFKVPAVGEDLESFLNSTREAYPDIPIVQTSSPKATIFGETKHSVESFYGVPYAEPPVGNLRFKPPQPLNWSFAPVISARNPSTHACPQVRLTYEAGGAF